MPDACATTAALLTKSSRVKKVKKKKKNIRLAHQINKRHRGLDSLLDLLPDYDETNIGFWMLGS